MATSLLDAEQAKALFNILTHSETYHEIEDFKEPETISKYGYPFAAITPKAGEAVVYATESSTPLLQSLFNKFVLSLPGVSSISSDFWNVRVQGILKKFAEVDLSESYEKGSLGTRKTLATASSTIIEAVTRGVIGGGPISDPATRPSDYNLQNASDLSRAWDDAMHGLVYENLCDELLDYLAETDDFESHSPMTRAACEYILIHLATLCHQVLVISPEGQYLVNLMDSVHKMVPYGMVRQTLRVGNAATMIAGMMKIFLAKLSVGSVSNWVGLTTNAADGQNLLQKIISVILGWDCTDFKKTVDKIAKAKDGPSKGALAAIKAHCQASKSERVAVRAQSLRESKSVVAVILEKENPALLEDTSDYEHKQCLDYYAALLAIRDREEIIAVLCKQSPDLLTQAIRDAVAGMDPIIRAVHNKVDLSDHVKDYQTFLEQLIATSKPKKAKPKSEHESLLPTVEDYVQLLKNNKQMLYKWLHAVSKNCPEVMDQFRTWAKDSLTVFDRQSNGASIDDKLNGLFSQVPDETKAKIIPAIDAHAAYLRELNSLSSTRMQAILEGSSSSMAGPGVYLMRWQSLLDETYITPSIPKGPIRCGKDVKGIVAQGSRKSVSSDAGEAIAAIQSEALSTLPEAPDVQPVIEALIPLFKKMLTTTSERKTNGTNGHALADLTLANW
ncbi:px domain-containing protein [Colletotrichum truncatum]|uniref:Px domain-containing protein n=1 Tax=Colletotrichum truncatum TaxID=5467 RepID=A0ACC3YWH6_COLTU|nr:px domain-containing protein [Colletotrichum truncatum]KAF6791117.1 px domain-containing protein [Colletotrichum truncatum]